MARRLDDRLHNPGAFGAPRKQPFEHRTANTLEYFKHLCGADSEGGDGFLILIQAAVHAAIHLRLQ